MEVFSHGAQKPYLHYAVLDARDAGHRRVIGEEVGHEYEEREEVVYSTERVEYRVVLLQFQGWGGTEREPKTSRCEHRENTTDDD